MRLYDSKRQLSDQPKSTNERPDWFLHREQHAWARMLAVAYAVLDLGPYQRFYFILRFIRVWVVLKNYNIDLNISVWPQWRTNNLIWAELSEAKANLISRFNFSGTNPQESQVFSSLEFLLLLSFTFKFITHNKWAAWLVVFYLNTAQTGPCCCISISRCSCSGAKDWGDRCSKVQRR